MNDFNTRILNPTTKRVFELDTEDYIRVGNNYHKITAIKYINRKSVAIIEAIGSKRMRYDMWLKVMVI